MAGKNVVVTGSTQGLGLAYAREFVRRGHCVAICGRNAASVENAIASLESERTGAARIVGQVCDTADRQQLVELWSLAQREFGAVDIWLNNAGLARTGMSFLDTPPEALAAMVDTNVVGTFNACDVAMAGMQTQGRGRIYITLGGGAKGRVVANMTAYSTTKRALLYLAKALVKEARATNPQILIGTISPGVNITEGMLREIAAVPEERRAQMLKPLNFLGEHVETTAPWIVERILADERQASDITWLTTGRLLRRGFGMLFRKRDILSRYGLQA